MTSYDGCVCATASSDATTVDETIEELTANGTNRTYLIIVI